MQRDKKASSNLVKSSLRRRMWSAGQNVGEVKKDET